jgi:hypothetical protein
MPEAVGVKVTLTTQVPFTAMGDNEAQLLFSAKSPPGTTLVTISGPVPELVKVTVCAVLAFPTI